MRDNEYDTNHAESYRLTATKDKGEKDMTQCKRKKTRPKKPWNRMKESAFYSLHMCMCVCVCEREREREDPSHGTERVEREC